ncbi:hypothetical protein niasHT_027916 [Heterodera trifolii]|uniref:Uncharacterized protein n=1 Tax=Heterodera trifolii TaxID=157864 RepID=A0ABD2JDS2_9BILA
MQKCSKKDKNWAEKMLLSYRTTPNSAINGHSPDQLFFGRKLRTQLSLTHPTGKVNETIDKTIFHQKQEKYRTKMAQNFNEKHGVKTNEFLPTDPVLVLNYQHGKSHWLQGTIIERLHNSPTYRVNVPRLGRNIHRHANQMRRRYVFDESLGFVGPAQVANDQNHQSPAHQNHHSPARQNPTPKCQKRKEPDGIHPTAANSPPMALRRSYRNTKPPIRFSPG